MKRVFLLFTGLLVVISAAGAAQALRTEVRLVVEKALAGERDAIARYEAFAAKADEEGYPGAAALFRAQARAESVHSRRFAGVLRSHGHAVPEPNPHRPAVGSTGDNLRAAAAAEAAERDGIYRDAVETCRFHGAKELATMFDQTRDAEVEHGNLCMAAARNLPSMKQARTYYVCEGCGYTTDVRLPMCPSCRRNKPPEPVQ
ncbi:MAG TPA: ferritin family protein [Thermoanaerobaculia bacterium]|nr:ferritin family protein [Thermoanaerobaculia bacterium]